MHKKEEFYSSSFAQMQLLIIAMIKPHKPKDMYDVMMKDGNRIIDELFGDILDDIEKKFGK